MEKIKIFEMFTGYGGASFALKKADIDFECVGYSEIDKSAIKIFETNFGKDIKNYGDSTRINPEELPDFDLLTGGFPCQPFSVNTRITSRGKSHESYNLFKDILRILEHKKPKYFLLENVKGILGEKSKEVYNLLCNGLREIGYDLKVETLNSKDYGTPQNRNRVFFIGKYGRWEEEELNLPKKEELKLTVEDIMDKDVTRREPRIKELKIQKLNNIEKYGESNRLDAILKNPVNKRNSNIAFEILDAPSNVVSRQSDRIYKPNYAPCLTATGKDYIFYIDEQLKVLTVKECFRLMGFFKDEIKLDGLSETQGYKLAGNSWDINLVSKIFKGILNENKTKNIQGKIENLNKELEIVNEKNRIIDGEIKEKEKEKEINTHYKRGIIRAMEIIYPNNNNKNE